MPVRAIFRLQPEQVELFNEAPCLQHLALKPCCLPGLAFAERDETFELGRHAFAACEVCADGRWRRGNQWVGKSGRAEVEAKFGSWARHLCLGVEAGAELQEHRVQARWFQNAFIFSSRPFSPALPPSVLAHRAARAQRAADAKAAAAAAVAAAGSDGASAAEAEASATAALAAEAARAAAAANAERQRAERARATARKLERRAAAEQEAAERRRLQADAKHARRREKWDEAKCAEVERGDFEGWKAKEA